MRFPEFTEPWETAKLGAIAEFSKGTGISKEQRSETGLPCILYGELYTTYTNEVIEDVVSKTDLDPTDLVKSQKNDVIIPSSGETAEDIATARCVTSDNVLLGGDLNIIRLVEPNDGRFMSYQLNGIRKYDIAKIAQGVSVVHLYGGDLKMLSVTFPQSPEQKKIADCISLLDRRISVQSGLIEDLKNMKKHLMDQSFCLPKEKAPKLRQRGMSDEWKKVRLCDVVERVTTRNKTNECTRVLTIAAQYGLIDQQEFFNKQIASSDLTTYYLLHRGDFAYNKSYSSDYPWGAVKRLDNYEEGVLSSLYICFCPNHSIDSDFLRHYFESTKWYRGISEISGEGARNHGLLNMSVEDFFNTTLRIPSIEEQKRIAYNLSKIETIIEKERSIKDCYIIQKQYLLRYMFI